jgi:hypothetical protein
MASAEPYLTVKGGWLPEVWRAVLVALRPWSITASFVPAALAAFVAHDSSKHNLLDAVLPVVAGVAAHLGANTTNTCVVERYAGRARTCARLALTDAAFPHPRLRLQPV